MTVSVAASLLAACDSGDGRSLEPPVFPPPATTIPVDSSPSGSIAAEPPAAPLRIVAPWPEGARIPVRHTCDGENVSPALTWTDVPDGTAELALTLTDLDAPSYVHWVVYGIAPEVTGAAEGTVPDGAIVRTNSAGSVGYAGPCPPDGETHRYLFTVHALNQQVEPADETDAVEIVELLQLISIDQSSVSGVSTGGG